MTKPAAIEIREPNYRCPQCVEGLSPTADGASLYCATCGAAYPILGAVPILVPQPWKYLADQAVRLTRAAAQLRGEIDKRVGWANEWPKYANEFLTQSRALKRNLSIAERFQQTALERLTARHVVAALENGATNRRQNDYDFFQIFDYARRDWGGEDACEEEALTIARLAGDAIEEAKAGARILSLGAGTGRIADELDARFGSVDAIDLSLPMALFHDSLRTHSTPFSVVELKNKRRASDTVVELVAARRRRLRTGVRYAVADATMAPWPDGAFSCLASVYFTDLIPLSKLLPAAIRLLQPNGVFVHVGPLGYHHERECDHLAAEQLAQRLSESGFQIVKMDFQRSTHLVQTDSLQRLEFQNMILVARKEISDNTHRSISANITPRDVLSICGKVTISTCREVSDAAEDILSSELKTSTGISMKLSPPVTRLMEIIDGNRTYAEIVDHLIAMTGAEELQDEELAEIQKELTELVNVGALAVVSTA